MLLLISGELVSGWLPSYSALLRHTMCPFQPTVSIPRVSAPPTWFLLQRSTWSCGPSLSCPPLSPIPVLCCLVCVLSSYFAITGLYFKPGSFWTGASKPETKSKESYIREVFRRFPQTLSGGLCVSTSCRFHLHSSSHHSKHESRFCFHADAQISVCHRLSVGLTGE